MPGGNSHNVFIFDGGNATGPNVPANVTRATILDGVTITRGHADESLITTISAKGAGLYCDGSGSGNACSPQIIGVTFTGNTASSDTGGAGGAMYNNGSGGGTSRPLIANATFTGNTARFDGGAIFNAGDR